MEAEYSDRANIILQRADMLAAISDDTTCISRIFGTKAFVKSLSVIESWMQKAGLQTHVDHVGNVRGKWQSKITNAKTLVIGSHFDTVNNAGKYDGILGVLMAIDLVEQIVEEGIELPFNIEVVAFSDEEGVRFHTTYLGSKVLTGTLDAAWLDFKDDSGLTIAQVIEQIGGNCEKLVTDAIPKEDWLGYFEIHIEQGPVLWREKVPVAVVSGIAGQQRLEFTFYGEAGHAGTVPMNMRLDALTCAAECIVYIESYAKTTHSEVLATVGKMHIENSATNVIPGKVTFSLDIRSGNELLLKKAIQDIHIKVAEITARRYIKMDTRILMEMSPVQCDSHLTLGLAEAIQDCGCPLISLTSGAGHDAVAISQVAPVSMLFVRCYEGISHNPLENVELEDVAFAIKVSDRFVREKMKVVDSLELKVVS